VKKNKKVEQKMEKIEPQPILQKFYFEESNPENGTTKKNTTKYGPVTLDKNFTLLVGKSGTGKTRFLNVLWNLKISCLRNVHLLAASGRKISFYLVLKDRIDEEEVEIKYDFSVTYKEKVNKINVNENVENIKEFITLDEKTILSRVQNKVTLMSSEQKEIFISMEPYFFKMRFDFDKGNERIEQVLKSICYFFDGLRILGSYTIPSYHISFQEEENFIVKRDGVGLSNSYEYMKKHAGKLYDRVIKDACKICNITDVNFKKPNLIDLPISFMHLVENDINQAYPIVDAAGGTLRIFAIMNLIFAPGAKSLICIDEIDSNLDAIRIEKLIQYLQENRESIPQMLAVSHNPYFQDRCQLKEWVVVTKKGGEHYFKRVDEEQIDPLYQTGLYGNSRLYKDVLYDEEQVPLKECDKI